jgi:hypothetical protein
MTKDFDSEIKSIASARRAAVEAAKQQVAATAAAAAAFSKAWNDCRIKVVMPALKEIVDKLSAQKIGASIGELPGGGTSLIVPMPGIPRVRGRQEPQLTIAPTIGGNQRVTFGQPGTQPQNCRSRIRIPRRRVRRRSRNRLEGTCPLACPRVQPRSRYTRPQRNDVPAGSSSYVKSL